MKVNIVSNNSIVRPVPGTKFTTPVYGKDISEVQIIRILNFPALRVYDTATGVIITKKNINEILNKNDSAISEVKEVEHTIDKKKEKRDKRHTKNTEPIAVVTEVLPEEETVTADVVDTIAVNDNAVEESTEVETEPVDETTEVSAEEEVEATEVEHITDETEVKPQQQYSNNNNYNRKKGNNRNKH